MSAILNIPQLRFSEFSEEWEENKLGNIFNITAGGDIKSEYVSSERTNEFQYPVYANAKKDKGFYGYSNLYKISENVITVAGRGVNLGIAHARNHKFYPIVRLLVLNPKNDLDIYFFEYQINNLRLFIESTGVPQLTAPQISIYNILYPAKPEQEKIASFLSSVDTKIEQLTSKVKLLQEYKKGVMQKIFSQEIRFREDDGSDYPEWVEKELGKLCSITTGKLDANAMDNDGQFRFYTCAKEYFFIDNYAFDTDALIISGNGANVGYIHHYSGKFNAYQRTYVLDKFLDNIIFIKYFLDKYLHKRIMKEKNEGNTPYIVMGTLSDMKINIPSVKEQTKIANFLSSIDSKIEQVQKQLNSTKEFKKALLQQMFV